MRHHIEKITLSDVRHIKHKYISNDTIRQLFKLHSPTSVEDYYQWYAAGYRYPVVEAFVSTSNEKSEEEAWLCPLYSQIYDLSYDEPNDSIRRYVTTGNYHHSVNEREIIASSKLTQDLSIDISTIDGGVGISYSYIGRETLFFMVSDIVGRVLASCECPPDVGNGNVRMVFALPPKDNVIILFVKIGAEERSLKVLL